MQTKNGKNKKRPGPVARDMGSENPRGTSDPLSLAPGTGHPLLEIEGGMTDGTMFCSRLGFRV